MLLSILMYTIYIVVTIIYFVFLCIVFLLTAPFDPDRNVVHKLSAVWTKFYFNITTGWKVNVDGLEKVDRNQAYVVIVNHNSMADIPLMYVLPLYFKWVSKKEVHKWPIFGWVMYLHGDIAIERGTASGVRRMMKKGKMYLRRGISVIIFPEGSRSRDGEIHKFKEGAFLMAREAGVAILPCVAEGTGRITRGWRLNPGVKFTVKVLDPVPADEVAAADIKELSAIVRGRMIGEYDKIRQGK